MSAHAIPRLSPEEYLRVERESEIKHEYVDGQMYAMSGGSLAHSHIEGSIVAALKGVLAGGNCRVSTSNLRIQISPSGPFVYPDAAVYCGDAQLSDGYRDALLNPRVVFEVLSKSTEAYDRGQKFAQYRRIESLKDYVLVSQMEARIEVFSRTETGKWQLAEFVGAEAMCVIPSVGCEIALAEVYRDVTFETV
jgi:Uma2 family endonuclease